GERLGSPARKNESRNRFTEVAGSITSGGEDTARRYNVPRTAKARSIERLVPGWAGATVNSTPGWSLYLRSFLSMGVTPVVWKRYATISAGVLANAPLLKSRQLTVKPSPSSRTTSSSPPEGPGGPPAAPSRVISGLAGNSAEKSL